MLPPVAAMASLLNPPSEFQFQFQPPAFPAPAFPSLPRFEPAAPVRSAASPRDNKAALAFILSSSGSDTESDSGAARSSRSSRSSRPPRAPRAAAPKKGSKFCAVEGCGSRAKHARRCWKHGGSVKCRVPDCLNRAKSKGVCWSHGGGTACAFADCATISVSNGFCWAHGGGKRCQVAGCAKPAYERTKNLCTAHYRAVGGG